MKDIEAIFHIHETKDGGAKTGRTLGYSVIADATKNTLDTPQSSKFFKAMFNNQALGFCSSPYGNHYLIFDAQKGKD